MKPLVRDNISFSTNAIKLTYRKFSSQKCFQSRRHLTRSGRECISRDGLGIGCVGKVLGREGAGDEGEDLAKPNGTTLQGGEGSNTFMGFTEWSQVSGNVTTDI